MVGRRVSKGRSSICSQAADLLFHYDKVFLSCSIGRYCQYLYDGEPYFRTVGNDAMFYRPPTANQLRRYPNQIPEDFEMCFKIWEEITIPTYARQDRYGLEPELAEQHERMGSFMAPFIVLRLLTPPKMFYEVATKRAEPCTKIVEELPHMRRDTVALARKAVSEDRRVYVLVNNRLEGNVPLTVQALASSLAAD